MKKTTGFLLAGLFVALLLAGVASSFASSAPDGLDATVARGCTRDATGELTGGTCIARGAKDHEAAASPFADYGIAGLDNPYLSTGLSGVLGVLVTFGVAGGLFWLTRSRRRTPKARTPKARTPEARDPEASDRDARDLAARDPQAIEADDPAADAAQTVGAA